MSLMYIVLAPLFGKVLYDRIRLINRSVKHKNSGAIKVNVFFLVLIVIVGSGLVFLIQRME
jgi:hypothetical protein